MQLSEVEQLLNSQVSDPRWRVGRRRAQAQQGAVRYVYVDSSGRPVQQAQGQPSAQGQQRVPTPDPALGQALLLIGGAIDKYVQMRFQPVATTPFDEMGKLMFKGMMTKFGQTYGSVSGKRSASEDIAASEPQEDTETMMRRIFAEGMTKWVEAQGQPRAQPQGQQAQEQQAQAEPQQPQAIPEQQAQQDDGVNDEAIHE